MALFLVADPPAHAAHSFHPTHVLAMPSRHDADQKDGRLCCATCCAVWLTGHVPVRYLTLVSDAS